MATIVTRSGKGSALTHAEMDANFTNLNTDITNLDTNKIETSQFPNVDTPVLSSTAELNILDGATATASEINYLDLTTGPGTQEANKAVVADANVNTGASKVTELHIGASGSEVQVTATPAEINGLDGLTASKAMVTDGSGITTTATATAAEVDYLSGATSGTAFTSGDAIQTSVTLNNNFTSGTLYLHKFDGIVTITWTASTHSASTTASTSTGRIPSAYRPTADIYVPIFGSSSSVIYKFGIKADGTFTSSGLDETFSATSPSASPAGTTSYRVY